jgi:hypothetical protein
VTESDPIGWRGVVYGTPVAAADGARIGTVREMLGSDAEDIFHGIRVSLSGKKRDVMIPSGDVTALTRDEVRTKLSQAEVEGLAPYDEVASYHLASVGWLRKHLGWTKDSSSDEESG